jgi:hypothetical protein
MILFIYFFQYLIDISLKRDNSILNKKKTKIIKVLTVESFFPNSTLKTKLIELKKLSGEYEELSSKETMKNNNNNNKYNIEEIYFLLTTNTKRIRRTINFIKFWSKSSNVKCLIVFEEKDFLGSEGIKEYIQSNEISCQIKTSNIKRYEERDFQLVQLAWNDIKKLNKSKNISWFAIGDDDTIWFINNLLKTLEEYNSSKLIYLGNISDRNESIQRHGNDYAYGGGGILLSKPLIQLINQYYQQCQKLFFNLLGGDQILGKCITQLLNINLTINKHFHQIDLQGNIQGFLQSGINGLVTLHHMFSLWEPFPEEHFKYEKDILNTIQLAYYTFHQLFFQRFFKRNFQSNQTLLLTIGYSFTLFNRILSLEELNQVEITWENSQLYQIQTRPKENNKINWFFKQLITQDYNGQKLNGSIYQNNQAQIQIIFN